MATSTESTMAGSFDYLGQDPPGGVPELFAPQLISTHRDELNSIFAPDGSLFLFAVKLPYRGHHTLLALTRQGSDWSEPAVLPFSGTWSDADPAFSADGRHLYFISTRPESGNESQSWDIFVVERLTDGWGVPRNLGEPVNTDGLEVHPSLAADGTLYFSSSREGGYGRNDIYRSRLLDGRYQTPENLGPAVNSEFSEGDLYVAPDESYLIFSSSGRPDDLGRGDLYISFRNDDGSWRPAQHLGPTINSRFMEYCPAVTPDGKYFFFTSYRRDIGTPMTKPLTFSDIDRIYRETLNGLGNIYWVSTVVLDRLR
jgi:Tol biopolymer transport system component